MIALRAFDARGLLQQARAGRRYVVAIIDQGLISITNFMLTIWMLKVAEPAAFGVFALIIALATFVSAMQESIAATPLSVRYSTFENNSAKGLLFGTITNSLYVFLGILVPVGVMVAVILGQDASLIIAAGAFVAAFTLRSYLRSYAYARQAGNVTLAVSAIMLLAHLVVMIVFSQAAALTLPRLLWALALVHAAPATLLMLWQFGRGPRFSWQSLRRYRYIWHQASWALFGVMLNFGQRRIHAVIVPTLSSPAAYASLAAAESLFGPIRLVFVGLAMVLRPELARLRADHDWAGMQQRIVLAILAILMVNLAVGLTIYVLWDWINGLLFAEKYPDIALPIVCAGMIIAAAGVRFVLSIALQSHLMFRQVALGDLVGASVSTVLTILIILTAGHLFVLFGLLVGELACLVMLYTMLHSHLRRVTAETAAAAAG
jgi:O-antigen/teichoic acid export membrane protein